MKGSDHGGQRVAVIGLGSMGSGIGQSLLRAGFEVAGFDPDPAALDAFAAAGGERADSARAAAKGAVAVLCVVVNGAQTEAVLFGPEGVAAHMAPDAVFLAMATIPPAQTEALAARLQAQGPAYLDVPISGGAAKAAAGSLSIMGAGPPEAFDRVADVLDAVSENLFRLGDRPGQGSSFKIVNQLLAGVHIATAAEAMAFAAGQGLDLEEVYRVITASAGNSWMFADRMRRVLDGDTRPRSTTDIFVKDLGIVLDEARRHKLPVPLSAAALQMFLTTSATGLGAADDSSIADVYARLAGRAGLLPADGDTE